MRIVDIFMTAAVAVLDSTQHNPGRSVPEQQIPRTKLLFIQVVANGNNNFRIMIVQHEAPILSFPGQYGSFTNFKDLFWSLRNHRVAFVTQVDFVASTKLIAGNIFSQGYYSMRSIVRRTRAFMKSVGSVPSAVCPLSMIWYFWARRCRVTRWRATGKSALPTS